MLERLRLFRNKNKKAGDEQKAEQNIREAEKTDEIEQQSEDKFSSQQSNEDRDK